MQPAVRDVQPEIDLMRERVLDRVVADTAASHGDRPKSAAVIADNEKGRRVGAGLVIAQWRGEQPVAVHPPSVATHPAMWVGA